MSVDDPGRIRRPTWRDHAACRGVDTDLFIRDERRRGAVAHTFAAALAYCDRCPVRHPCLDEAMTRRDEGVWGGTTRSQREQLARGIVRARCPVCTSPWLHTTPTAQVCMLCGVSWHAVTRKQSSQRRRRKSA